MALSQEGSIVTQQKELVSILEKYGVDIIWAEDVPGSKYQIFTRDPFIVIDDKFILSHMKERERQSEPEGAKLLLDTVDPVKKICSPQDAIVEGGDIIPHGDKLLIGQDGLRTNKNGFEFIKKHFENKFDIIPIYMQENMKDRSLMHLDCAFSPVWYDTMLVAPDGIRDKSLYTLQEIFPNIITVSKRQCDELGVNVISLGDKTVIVQKRHKKIINNLESKGFNVEVINSYASADLEGFSRCMTCPLERELL